MIYRSMMLVLLMTIWKKTTSFVLCVDDDDDLPFPLLLVLSGMLYAFLVVVVNFCEGKRKSSQGCLKFEYIPSSPFFLVLYLIRPIS